jgi:phage terminase small subunit
MQSASPRPLTDRQERFVHEYLIDQNATQAAIRAGYSAKTQGGQAAELMKNPEICRRIAAGLQDLFTRLKLTAERVMRERMRIAFFDARTLFDAAGRPLSPADMDEETQAALLVHYDFKPDGGVGIKVRQQNKSAHLAALERLLRAHAGLQNKADEALEPAAPLAGLNIEFDLDQTWAAKEEPPEAPVGIVPGYAASAAPTPAAPSAATVPYAAPERGSAAPAAPPAPAEAARPTHGPSKYTFDLSGQALPGYPPIPSKARVEVAMGPRHAPDYSHLATMAPGSVVGAARRPRGPLPDFVRDTAAYAETGSVFSDEN